MRFIALIACAGCIHARYEPIALTTGMTYEDVRARLGPPKDIFPAENASDPLAKGCDEVWQYGHAVCVREESYYESDVPCGLRYLLWCGHPHAQWRTRTVIDLKVFFRKGRMVAVTGPRS